MNKNLKDFVKFDLDDEFYFVEDLRVYKGRVEEIYINITKSSVIVQYSVTDVYTGVHIADINESRAYKTLDDLMVYFKNYFEDNIEINKDDLI